MNNITPFTAGAILTATELVGDYGAKVDSIILAHGSYNLLAYELRMMLRTNSLSLVNANWDGISNLATMALGYYMGERLTTTQYVGAAMISAGIYLLH